MGRGRYWSMTWIRVLAKPDFCACAVDTRETTHKSFSNADRFPRKQREEKVQIRAVCKGRKTIAQLRPQFLKGATPGCVG